MSKSTSSNKQRSIVKNSNNPAFIQDKKNTIRQLQRTEADQGYSNPVLHERIKHEQRELAKAALLQEREP